MKTISLLTLKNLSCLIALFSIFILNSCSGSKTSQKAPPVNQERIEKALLGSQFMRVPEENGYHFGHFGKASNGNLTWYNQADVSWDLKPDYSNLLLDATIGSNPYKNDKEGKSFKLIVKDDNLKGFEFLGELYEIVGGGSDISEEVVIPTCEKQKLTVPVEYNTLDGYSFSRIYKNQGIQIGEYEQPMLCHGTNWVFYTRVVGPDEPRMADEEYTNEFLFSVPPPKGKEFTLSTSDFKAANPNFYQMCYCPETGYIPLNKGTINGKLLADGKWEITVNAEYGKQSKMDLNRKYFFETK